jgi:hypothetical protein
MNYNSESKNYFFRELVCLLIVMLSVISYSQTKQGGVCFKIGGNGPLAKLQDLDDLFTSHHNSKVCICASFGLSPYPDVDYINQVKTMQSHSHEVMDLTPNHRTNYFNTDYNYSGSIGSGVEHISGSGPYKVCLSYGAINTADAIGSGTVDISGNTLTSTSGNFPDFISNEYYYLYIPDLSQLLLINTVDSGTQITVTDPWVDAIDLGTETGKTYYYFDNSDIHMTTNALNILADESIRLAALYGITQPVTWIQPGGANSFLSKAEVKAIFGTKGYTAASVYPDASLKVFNEYDPGTNDRFGMNWGDFEEDALTLAENKKLIADGTAKHHVLIGHAYFPSDAGEWTAYLTQVGLLLDWCYDNSIPVKTYSEWANTLYSLIPDATENIMPRLNIDLDGDGNPDGYTKGAGATLNNDDGAGVSGSYNYSIGTTGTICSVTDLGGLYKGDNDFEIYLKGNIGDVVRVTFHGNSTAFDYYFDFTISSTSWTAYYLSQATGTDNPDGSILKIPAGESTMSITVSSTTSTGTVKVSSMRFAQNGTLPVELTSFSAVNKSDVVELNWNTATEVNNYGFEIERSQKSNVKSETEWTKIGFVKGNGNSNSIKDYSYVDNLINSGSFKYRLKQIDNDGTYKYSDEIEVNVIPTEYELSQNYPNPFNPTTTIKYSLPRDSRVSLEVFNIVGEKVAELVNNFQPAGMYTISFNGSNLASGTYFYRLQAGDFTQINKLVLLK